ncbi:hypothetical protein [Streptomyces deccanensis]|uniref:hypothetical protein n=1 Tax=Streptomyces deccanensis TaxID=424188 RepID=UPI001EFB6FEB|nr:hypothetical protein [Streptomyces deccanensis]ULR48469.1 hypothetical protein L3078_03815 [Streptomyces deccanensis]
MAHPASRTRRADRPPVVPAEPVRRACSDAPTFPTWLPLASTDCPRSCPLSESDLDQRLLLHSVADRLDTVADHLPLPDQIGPDPALSEILDDEILHLARLFSYLAGEHAFRHRATSRYPSRGTTANRLTALALASAAEATGAALAALGAAVHHLGHLADLTHQPRGPARDQACIAVHQALADRVGEVRAHLTRASKELRTAADTRTTPHTFPVRAAPAASASTSRTR